MRSRASLALMEQLIMVLVFALAAALCLRCFAASEAISQETIRRDRAVQIAQNAAERLKAGQVPEQPEAGFDLELREEDSGIPGLAQTEIRVLWEGELLYTLNTGWQEVGR